MRSRTAALAIVMLSLVLLSGCGSKGGPAVRPSETPAEAAKRLFPRAYQDVLEATEHPDVLKGATVGEPVPGSKDYAMSSPLLAQWALSDDLHATSGMFPRMKRLAMRDDHYLVPMVKDGVSVCEFEIGLDAGGRWEWLGSMTDPLPGGQIYTLQQAEAALKAELGADAKVRPVIFLPSGLEFAVGSNGKREAAVYVTFTNHGTGVGSFDKFLPKAGTMYTPDQLKDLLTPGTDAIRIRVRNVGRQTLSGVVLKFPSDTVECGDLVPGAVSDFSVVESAYRYTYVQAFVDGEKRELKPVDYVGEDPLEPGSYTYEIRAVSRNGMKNLDLELRQESGPAGQ